MTTALTLAAQVRSGQRSAREVVEEALTAVAAGDTELNAFLTVLGDEARAQADAVDAAVAAGRDPGPLAGVPVALKDNLCLRGSPTTCGSKILEGWRPPYDATVVGSLRRAGAIAIGKALASSRITLAMRSARTRTPPASAPSIITRMSGSVPDARTRIRPLSPSCSCAAQIAERIRALSSKRSRRSTRTLTRTCG